MNNLGGKEMGTQLRRVIGFVAGFLLIMVIFQNCGDGYNSKESITTSSTQGTTTVSVPNFTEGEISSGDIVEVNMGQINNNSNTTGTSLLNFVAGDRLSCQRAVRDRLGEAYLCQVGAGCGVSCGMPGSGCASANPNHYGVCIEVDSQDNVVSHSSNSIRLDSAGSQLYNIVAGDKTTCERTARQMAGGSYACFQGGGCGMSCGIPGTNCQSASPTLFGLCLEVGADQRVIDFSEPEIALGSGPASPLMDSRNLLNIVNGMGQAACEQQVRDRFGVSYSCLRGGGCGISCGMPGGNCASANPQHFGLCIYAPNGEIEAVTPGSARMEVGSGPASPLQDSRNLMNFVNGMGKAACEQQIRNRFGVGYTCLRGGGCGVSCGMPGGSCTSANPQHFGLCLSVSSTGQVLQVSPGSQRIP
ncbi:MAG: hypothetical protein HRT44_13225 [Bdellovibrionales bacterium]|nr:hypothetical protein [Bdellovibrionales bacterium]NQZ20199.1 hypothetical protein [Bdellovibrionales bacterium]